MEVAFCEPRNEGSPLSPLASTQRFSHCVSLPKAHKGGAPVFGAPPLSVYANGSIVRIWAYFIVEVDVVARVEQDAILKLHYQYLHFWS